MADIFLQEKSKIKNKVLLRWRFELAEYRYSIEYRPGNDKIGADALSSFVHVKMESKSSLFFLHSKLKLPGLTIFWH